MCDKLIQIMCIIIQVNLPFNVNSRITNDCKNGPFSRCSLVYEL